MLRPAFVIDQGAAGLGKGPAREQASALPVVLLLKESITTMFGILSKNLLTANFIGPAEKVVFEDDYCFSFFPCSGLEGLPEALGTP